MADTPTRVLLTGATGYVGGRLLPGLLQRGLTVHALVRHPKNLRLQDPHLIPFRGDVLDPAALQAALKGVQTAYYLIHSMGADKDYVTLDRQAAQTFGAAARAAGVRRIIYLGGLAHATPEIPLSPHMASRMEVGECLRASGVAVTEFRASIVIGSGSLSFEMIRALVERLPAMITPRWVRIAAQPIGIEDLLAYLLAALDQTEIEDNRIYEIGGADRMSYGDLMQEYARQRGLRRRMIPVPVLTPHLSSLWLGLVTPLYARIGKKLIGSIRNASIVEDERARQDFPIRPQAVADVIAAALRNEDQAFAATRWSDALSSTGPATPWGGERHGARLVDSRCIFLNVPPAEAFAPVQRIGGEQGWYYANFLWRVRGMLDLWVGGVGLRRGRRHPVDLHIGDPVDWWRVEAFEPGKRLLLRAEMKVPGRAWLEFTVTPTDQGTALRQTALFDPAGVWGRIYWYTLYPIHVAIFAGMLRRLAATTGHRVAACSRP